MNNKRENVNIKRMVLSPLFLVIGMILPFITGQIPAIGNMLLPMHIPVLICGFVCGWKYGFFVGLILPVFRSMIFGMPILFPTACAMAIELAAYGLCTGLLHRKFGYTWKGLYLSLIGSMLLGRAAWGMAAFVFYKVLGNVFTWEIFFAQAFIKAIPGIVLQILVIPPIVKRIPLSNYPVMRKHCTERFQKVENEIRRLLSDQDAGQIIIGIDGMCAGGKTTMGYYLKEKFDANLFHMDDFFLQPYQRTQERYAEIGGNVDYERFQEEVLTPLLAGEMITYRPFSCKRGEIIGESRIAPKRVNIIEGSYSLHPYFGDVFNMKIFMEIGEKDQIKNICRRNGEKHLKEFTEHWIPMETRYFEGFEIKQKCDYIVKW